jgi:hypothetical protein
VGRASRLSRRFSTDPTSEVNVVAPLRLSRDDAPYLADRRAEVACEQPVVAVARDHLSQHVFCVRERVVEARLAASYPPEG